MYPGTALAWCDPSDVMLHEAHSKSNRNYTMVLSTRTCKSGSGADALSNVSTSSKGSEAYTVEEAEGDLAPRSFFGYTA